MCDGVMSGSLGRRVGWGVKEKLIRRAAKHLAPAPSVCGLVTRLVQIWAPNHLKADLGVCLHHRNPFMTFDQKWSREKKIKNKGPVGIWLLLGENNPSSFLWSSWRPADKLKRFKKSQLDFFGSLKTFRVSIKKICQFKNFILLFQKSECERNTLTLTLIDKGLLI